jgi:hypothetical protein
MRVELTEPESVAEPRLWVEHQQVLALVLRPGSVEWGLRRSEMQRVDYSPGEMGLCRRHEGRVDHATRDNRQHDGSLHHHRRACWRDIAYRTQASGREAQH